MAFWLLARMRRRALESRKITNLDPRVLSLFASGWSPEETLGQWNESVPGFRAQNNRSSHETANQKKIYFIRFLLDFPKVSQSDQPLTKKPEDSGNEIER